MSFIEIYGIDVFMRFFYDISGDRDHQFMRARKCSENGRQIRMEEKDDP